MPFYEYHCTTFDSLRNPEDHPSVTLRRPVAKRDVRPPACPFCHGRTQRRITAPKRTTQGK